jgi:hypothetical protein
LAIWLTASCTTRDFAIAATTIEMPPVAPAGTLTSQPAASGRIRRTAPIAHYL